MSLLLMIRVLMSNDALRRARIFIIIIIILTTTTIRVSLLPNKNNVITSAQ